MGELGSRRQRLHEIIFEADTPEGKTFDIVLLLAIVCSVIAVVLESVESIAATHGPLLRSIEWAFTVLFTLEYGLRLATIGRPRRYALSAFGIIDLLAIVPTYLSVFFVGTQSLVVIRALRLLREIETLTIRTGTPPPVAARSRKLVRYAG